MENKKIKKFEELWKEVKADKGFEVERNILDFTTSLYQLMKKRNFSKKELADRLDTSQAYITKIFKGDANFTIATMTKLVNALDGKLHITVTPREEKVQQWFRVIELDKRAVVPEWQPICQKENFKIDETEVHAA